MGVPRWALIAARGQRTQAAVCAAVKRLAAEAGEPEPGINPDRLRKWEQGKERPSPYYAEKLCRVYGMTAGELGLASEAALVVPERLMGQEETREALELLRQAEASDIGEGTLDVVEAAVERYCRSYSATPPPELLREVAAFRGQVRHLLAGSLTLKQRQRLLVAAAWLSLLLACLQFDVGDRSGAAVSRDVTLRLAEQTGHTELMAWSFELLAWWAVMDGRYREAVEFARTGIRLADERTSARVQLGVKEAEAWSCIGGRQEAEIALAGARLALARLGEPEHPDNHFVFDPPKLTFYASTIYAHLGLAQQAEEHALAVISSSVDEHGVERWPTRSSVVRFDLSLAHLQRGRPDEAAHVGTLGLETRRKSTSTMVRAVELDRILQQRYGDLPEVREYHERFRLEARSQQ